MMDEHTENPLFKEKLKKYSTLLKRRIKTARKYHLKAQHQYEDCVQGPTEHRHAELLKAHISQHPKAKQLTVEDWETGEKISFTLTLPPKEELAKRFKRAKKLTLGLPHALRELEQATTTLSYLQLAKSLFDTIKTPQELDSFLITYPLTPQEKVDPSQKTPPKPYHTFTLDNGDTILVGKTASANDALTFSHARGNDYWLHATGVPGSHVIIHRPHEPLTPSTLNQALQYALYYSKARHLGEGEVSLTQVKYVKKIGRKPGLVQISQEKRYLVKLKK